MYVRHSRLLPSKFVAYRSRNKRTQNTANLKNGHYASPKYVRLRCVEFNAVCTGNTRDSPFFYDLEIGNTCNEQFMRILAQLTSAGVFITPSA